MSALARIARGALVAFPCFLLAGTLLLTWIDPMSISNGKWVKFGVAIMVLEFVLVHSGAMMAAWRRGGQHSLRKLFLFAFGFYSLFAGAMAAAFRSWELFAIFTLVMVSRWIGLATDPDRAVESAMRRSGMSIVFYLVAVFSSVIFSFPELGVTTEVLNQVYPDRGGGEWERHPETALAAGIIYFSLLGLTELAAGFSSPPPDSPVAGA